MVEDVRADYIVEQIVAPDFYNVGNTMWLTMCPIHKRSLTYIELIQQRCHWCYPMGAAEYLCGGKTKNPCYNHEAHRPFTKEEMDEQLSENRRYHKKING
jgi:hypothetical protein